MKFEAFRNRWGRFSTQVVETTIFIALDALYKHHKFLARIHYGDV